jgi:hypothetical protein
MILERSIALFFSKVGKGLSFKPLLVGVMNLAVLYFTLLWGVLDL